MDEREALVQHPRSGTHVRDLAEELGAHYIADATDAGIVASLDALAASQASASGAATTDTGADLIRRIKEQIEEVIGISAEDAIALM